jgi:hypothetical protein
MAKQSPYFAAAAPAADSTKPAVDTAAVAAK